MKIQTLLELIDTKQKTINYRRGIDHNRIAGGKGLDANPFDHTPEVGKGYFSRVTPDKNDPHMVKKKSTMAVDSERDGYRIYINAIASAKAAEGNPYFPRVYSAKTLQDPDGNALSNYTMEKLVDWRSQDVSLEEILPAIIAHIGEEKVERSKELMSDFSEADFKDKLMWFVANKFDACADVGVCNALPPLAKEAQDFISHIVGRNRRELVKGLDIKNENLMFRRTPHGMQLVITDPIA